MRIRLAVILLSAVAVLALTLVAARGTSHKQTGVVPFVATMAVASYSPPDNPIPEALMYETWAVRSDGASMRANHAVDPDGKMVLVRTIVLSDRYVVADPITESVTTYQPTKPLVLPVDGCPGVPGGTILGHPVNVTSEDRNTKDGQVKNNIKKWLALDLNCFPLREESITTTFAGAAVNVHSAVSLQAGEPSASLFEVPAAFIERSPAEVQAELNRRYPGKSIRVASQAVDLVYQSRKLK